MAYRIKNVRYQDDVRKILLQNENGPCPLLAAANALLLRGLIELPTSCIRTEVVSIEQLVTLLADRALRRNVNNSVKPVTPEEEEAILLRNKQSQHQIGELMDLLPNLQYGMDVNPKFMQGAEGYEYTKNLTAFDIMGVSLVHGWLLDPQDTVADIIGSKTYNELVELVVRCKDIEDEETKLSDLIEKKKESIIDIQKRQKSTEINEETKKEETETEWVKVSDNSESSEHDESSAKTIDKDSVSNLEMEIKELEQKREELHQSAANGRAVDLFLSETSHQLTTYGLQKLHEHVEELDVCVFFRNNHFSTMTKFEGQLFLLVTDLGYANVEDVVWEKLDAIDGNTDYYNAFFYIPEQREDFILDGGSTLLPEQLAAQSGQSELDYQLALSLQANNVRNGDEDTQAVEAAKKRSLKERCEDITESSVDRDRQYALSLQTQFQSQDASEILARQLYAEEKRMSELRANAARKKESSCIIS